MTLGVGGPAVSAAEDVSSVGLSIAALLLPVLVVLLIAAVIFGFVALFRRKKRDVPLST